jgi:radical SAM protein with 4Fe4S-binding SPASM domain
MTKKSVFRKTLLATALSLSATAAFAAHEQTKKPNVIVIMTDDVGWGDLGSYGGGVMRGAPTPNLDRMAAEGMRFVNYYGQASCTAGRASFITGRIPIRTSLSSVLVPGEPKQFRSTAPQHWAADDQPVVGTSAARPGTPDSIVTDWSVDADDWGRFLCAVFDQWYANDLGRVLVSVFETAVAQTMGLPAQTCVTAEFCGKALAMEHDGTVYSCDHYVYPEYALGNIGSRHLGRMAFSDRQQSFGFAKRDTLPSQCKGCQHLKLCWGECPKNRFVKTSTGEPGLNYLCPGLMCFYGHAADRLAFIASQLQTNSPG